MAIIDGKCLSCLQAVNTSHGDLLLGPGQIDLRYSLKWRFKDEREVFES